MSSTFRFKILIGLFALIFMYPLHAGHEILPEDSFQFVLQKDATCESGFAADDDATDKIEHVCADFDLSGLEASAFQAGIALGEVGDTGKFRPYWPLVRIVFNTEPRPMPNPAVSPLIFFRFVRDELCSSGYSGELLAHPDAEKGCLVFNLSGYRGTATREESFLAGESAEWLLSNLLFEVPSGVNEW